MTREEAKELLPIIQAYADGRTILIKHDGNWFESRENTEIYFSESPSDYRIKPETKYRPVKTKEECWNEMLKHQPFGWSKHKEKQTYDNWICVYNDSIDETSFDDAYKDYTFADGTPFGIKED